MTVLLLAALLLPPPTAGVPNPVELQDPAGDTGFSPTDAPAPDLRSVAVGMSPSGDLILRARFTPGTFDAAATYVQFSLQLERTDSTPDASTQCGNYLVDFNGVGKRSRNAKVQRLGSAGQYEVAGAVPVVVAADRIRITVPVKLLPADFCRVDFRVVAGIRLGDDALSIILDRAPDSGVPSGVLKLPTCGRTRG